MLQHVLACWVAWARGLNVPVPTSSTPLRHHSRVILHLISWVATELTLSKSTLYFTHYIEEPISKEKTKWWAAKGQRRIIIDNLTSLNSQRIANLPLIPPLAFQPKSRTLTTLCTTTLLLLFCVNCASVSSIANIIQNKIHQRSSSHHARNPLESFSDHLYSFATRPFHIPVRHCFIFNQSNL